MASNLLLAFVFAGVPGVLMAVLGLGHVGNYVRMKRLEPVDIRTMDEQSGEVELTGTAGAHEGTSLSPFTSTETVVQEWTVKAYNPRGRRSNWTLLDSGEDSHPFVLEDSTGSVLVDPAGASRYLASTTTIEVEPDESPPSPIREYLDGTDDVDSNPSRKRRYTESRLDPGGNAYVLGPVRESGHSVDLPAGVDAVVGVENPDERGITVGEDGLSEVVEQVKADTDQFIITNSGERRAQRGMLWRGILFFGAGLVFVTVPLALLLLG
ncbi:hypothetical protein BRC65_01375 [Halobacteriales archaeon QH_2_65_14]|nr:MAG: hypothetical protein BRC65_01375 [Halobacteriales archaeon QH_2_65_14]